MNDQSSKQATDPQPQANVFRTPLSLEQMQQAIPQLVDQQRSVALFLESLSDRLGSVETLLAGEAGAAGSRDIGAAVKHLHDYMTRFGMVPHPSFADPVDPKA